MRICIILPYANPHDTGWIDELISLPNHHVTVGIVNSVKKYRNNHFEEADNKEEYLYFFKSAQAKKNFYKEVKKCDCLITLGMFEKWFLEIIFFMPNVRKIYVLSEPFRQGSKRKLVARKLYISLVTLIKKSSKFSILCMGGDLVKKQYLAFGLKHASFYQFGHFPLLHLHTKDISIKISVIKFIFVGQLIPRKGIEVLIKAIKYLEQKYSNWEFLIIGKGHLKDEIIKVHEKEERIKYIENVRDPGVMKAYFNDNHILFLPSYFDGWGAVVNEALSSCCSLFLSKEVYAGVALLKDYENGFRFNPKNENELFFFIDKYFSNPGILIDHFKKSEEIVKEWNYQNAAISFSNMLMGIVNSQNKSLLKTI